MGVWEWDVQTDAVFWSSECFAILGVESYDGTMNAFTSIVHPEDLSRVTASIKRALAHNEEFRAEFRVVPPDGKMRWLSNLGKASYDDNGRPLRMIGTVQDITERRTAEEERLTLFRAVEQSSNMVVITDVQANIEYVNPKFTEVTGYSAAEVIGQNPRILKSGETPIEEYQRLWETILSGEEWRGEFHNKRKNGELYWEYATISPIKNPQGVVTHFLAIKEDLSVRKSLEEQLRQSQKMEAVGRLAGGIAHDFNNLLTVIVGYSEMMGDALQPDAPLWTDVQEIKKAGERASTLVRQLLAFSRRQVLLPKILNLNRVIRDLEKMLRRLIGEDVELVTILSRDLGMVKADVGQIEQVIVNLAVNSRAAMPSGGRLTIETVNAELDQAYARSHISVQPGPYVLLAVTDTGSGMDSKVLRHIFEPFFTTKEQGKGTGLGLSTVYGIVKQSGGNIWVYSEPGLGTTFKIYLPRVSQPITEIERPLAEVESFHGAETVLVVEDEDTVRRLAVETLARQGYQVLEAKNPGEALTVWKSCGSAIHLLLTDMVMPGMSGRDLAGRMSSLFADLKVLYMSGYTDNALVLNHGLDPGMDLIQKPFTPRTLLQKVRQTLDSN
jgi:PAS domain S-box-containing protein